MKEKHAQAIERLCESLAGKSDDSELRLGVGQQESDILRIPKLIFTPPANRILHRIAEEIKKSKWINRST